MTIRTETTLADLGLTAQGGREAHITGLSVDSRHTKPGHLFAAMPGTRAHGAEFVSFALRMGAVAVLTDRAGARIAAEALAGSEAALVVAEDPRQALACAAALFYGAQPATMVAVTGTAGKTSVASFTRQIWTGLGRAACNLGTMGVQGAYEAPLSHTTPEPITLHRLLAEMARAGVTHAAMEASSHGLEQRRLDGVALKAAAFTNFSQDHLDYHAGFEEYFAAKAGLFDRVLPEDGTAVINIDDPRGAQMLGHARARGQTILTVGRAEEADLRIVAQRYDATGQDLRFAWEGRPQQIRLDLIGGFQAENVLAAAGLVIAAGESPGRVFATLPELVTVRGRMELAATRANGATVFVDYSHKPGALAAAIASLRPHVMGRIVVVFGAGGDRDRGKRPLMGQVACEQADVVIVTDDNPRSEEPKGIRAEILQGCAEAIEVGDRAEAILRGVDALEPGDALLIAGKGHETGQIVGDAVYPFDDAEQASVAVAALDGRLS
ncbi:UDP-N-acetylmuramoyl-L-alanyl-D-glutamate--2,6-diaminopimelate ligase [Rhodovulum sulfidophilum]|uniref:UDP-N-acetylmuramoyl-L-alanyl-D-glutamate--2,6-diaminopimelate ligase n=1 Tax=Rhodovulum visakhapatnamense TaxID=364297 RepID=A0ABS1RGB7_9RHOB|nr:UDP-N-acetylmuramoyl-L-alanyl-D-glutamate--2,6-diaminopimelate ligase [Rhodovulum visakhapatnamense]MBL3569181.1 UDP-N-acetylmuramoyl-L-alanyl-D-glutamate--2,6-diaminopimelate ligase [Rhodovulum visakhapatnamense]MBL3578703.1 UDP-N-acetylmuramoyl-L-alanyl-D-glutamate--2,6-diaminopimelate ligase [Rhodovulum visakhapatnamense]OLS44362.1 UDP-N-acetylmuramoyl-L-alanyl-D-glutamate--2,6-diaminopimelate ligase [Rhodovulum sulfidophilum]